MFLISVLALAPACEDDTVGDCYDCGGFPPSQKLMPLTSREAVLNNIQYAYYNRQIEVINALLDADFTFFFAPEDVGGSIPEQWARVDELEATNSMFISNSQPVPIGPQIRSMDFDVQFEEGVEWSSFTPGGFPSETWYYAEVGYSFTIEVAPDLTLISKHGSTAQFTVRNAGSEEVPHYQLVECRDRGATMSIVQALEVAPDTWGEIKALWYY